MENQCELSLQKQGKNTDLQEFIALLDKIQDNRKDGWWGLRDNYLEKQFKFLLTKVRITEFPTHQRKFKEVLKELEELSYIPPNQDHRKVFLQGGSLCREIVRELTSGNF